MGPWKLEVQKKIVDKLIEKCTKNVEEVKISKMALLERGNEWVCSYTICIVLAIIALAISIRVGAYFVFSRWYLKKDVIRIKFVTRTQATI